MNKQEFRALIEKGPVFLDGATGTNLQAAGMPTGACPEQWILENPQVMEDLQKAYIEAGTNILYAPTFTANRIKLEEYGLEDKVNELNHKLVAISKQAAEGKAYVAADMSMTGKQLYPIGDMQFEELVNVYKEQVKAVLEAGVDLFVVETMMSLQESRAAVIAIKETCDLPILVSLTFEENGRTLFGTDPVTAVITLQSLGADAVGINCSAGPDKMVALVEQMVSVANIPILVKPNAGLPKLVDGKTVFDMEPEAFAKAVVELAKCGARIFGGCCGTTPAHIFALTKVMADVELLPVKTEKRSFLTSERKAVEIDINGQFLVVGERINPTGKKKLQEELRKKNLDYVCDMAEQQEVHGASILDINMGMNGIDEKEMMISSIYEVTSTVDLPLCIDSSYVEIIEEALRIYPGRALINSISLEAEKFEKLIPIAKKYGAMFILLPLSDAGLPKSINEKHEIIEAIVEAALKQGMDMADIIVDGLVATVGANPRAALECLETIRYCKDKGLATICGLSNISFGLPERSCINTAFLTAAITNGLTMAIANPAQEALMDAAYATDLLLNKEGADLCYIQRMNKKKAADNSAKEAVTVIAERKENQPKEKSLGECVLESVVNGNKGRILEQVKELLAKGEKPQTIINNWLIPGINRVGELFEQQVYFLPQLISSANTMQTAISYLEPMLEQDGNREAKATVVFATVEGDIHDIGKNLVVLMLKNYGYNVIDLGKDVPAETIIDAAIKNDAKVIGLSALMTTTMMRMKEVVELAKERRCTSKIMIGGAAVTESFSEEIGADGYSTDAADCVHLMEKFGFF